MHDPAVTSMTINKGTSYAVFAYDIGWSINLEDVNVTARRMEVLEWIIIVLIAISIAVSFFPMGGH